MPKLIFVGIYGIIGAALSQFRSIVFLAIAALMINGIFFFLPLIFIYCMVKYTTFAVWIRRLVEDGDDVPNKSDAKDAVILYFAYMVGWTLMDLILFSAMFDKELTVLIGSTSVLLLLLLGVSQISNIVKKH